MRVHALTVTAFGPFAGSVRVDVDALSREGLFLLCGPNGAGKTSVLDAIVFAIYGRVPGVRGQEKRLRSDHALASVRTEVSCELTLRGQRLRVTRRPEQDRPKARGSGVTRDQALLLVQRQVTGGWEAVSTRLDEGGAFLRDQVGLSPEQFWQVVLLPQGEFAAFLRAEPDQRVKVLETLFGAQRFADAEAWLAEHARCAKAALLDAEAQVQRCLHRVEQAVRGLPAPDGHYGADVPEPSDPDRVSRYVASQLSRCAVEFERAMAADEATEARLGTAEVWRDRGRHAVRAGARVLDLCRQGDRQDGRSERLEVDRVRLGDALRAEPLRLLLDGAEAAAQRSAAAATRLTRTWTDLVGLDPAGECPVRLRHPTPALPGRSRAAGASVPPGELSLVATGGTEEAPARALGAEAAPARALRDWGRALRDELARLADLESEPAAVEADQAALTAVDDRLRQRQATLDELHEIGAALPAALAALRARRERAQVLAAGLDPAVQARERAQARLTAVLRSRELTKLMAAAEAVQLAGQRSVLEAKEHWLSLREARLAGIAAELASHLDTGQPCPVCGSPEHPAPARPAPGGVSAADEQAATDLHECREAEAARSSARLAELNRELVACQSVTHGATVAEVTRELAAARTASATAQTAADELPELDAELAEMTVGGEALTRQVRALTQDQATDGAALESRSASLRTRRQRLEQAIGTDPTLAARRQRVAALADAADELAEAGAAHTDALARQAHAEAGLDHQIGATGFAGANAVREALQDDPDRDALARAIREWEDSRTGLTAELSAASREFGAALAELGGSVRLDRRAPPTGRSETEAMVRIAAELGELRTRLDREHADAGAARERAVSVMDRVRGIRGQLADLQVLVEQSLADCQPRRVASDRASDLAELVAGRGANVMRMRLRAYVLAARLEQVAAAATARLGEMTGGRYGFVHSDALRGGNRRSGLGLDILDSYTGTQRPTKTLSGGESFMASLALALGLADIVTAESGGIVLDTLFVDEGFGSLDPDSLDAVMSVLDELRQGGRVVGIVSHVEELRSRVPMQLQIRTGPGGSMLDQPDAGAVVVAGAAPGGRRVG